MIASVLAAEYDQNGFTFARGLFSSEEVESLIAHYMHLRASAKFPGDFETFDPNSSDPLQRYPRLVHMHRWDERSLQWLLDARLNQILTELCAGEEPIAAQTMMYFKPAGARGQALHQDQLYLRASPGTCIAAWLALDDCDVENGCLQVVAGSHRWPLLCTVQADSSQSFTSDVVPLPEGTEPIDCIMKAGDVLFFHGQVVHGSTPNVTKDRFRRSLIGHYVTGNSERVAEFYHPLLRMDGSTVEREKAPSSMECGRWVDNEIVMGAMELAEMHE